MDDPELTGEETRRLLQLRIEKTSRRVAMVAFVRGDPPSPEGADNNGMVSFLKLPGGKFLVTNHHVWDTFQAERAKEAEVGSPIAYRRGGRRFAAVRSKL